jgi:dolichol-phosphate mannosyltransferase
MGPEAKTRPMKTLVVTPTYNEKENIEAFLRAVSKEVPEANFLIVDDGSPDGTAQIVKDLRQENPRIHILERDKKEGLAKAYKAGFAWGFDKDYDVFVEMDADFSHRPVDLKEMLKALKDADFVVGSRYVSGGKTVNWPLSRKILSYGGSLYSKILLGSQLNDWTGGFNGWKKSVLDAIGMDKVESEGYTFQIEMKYRALRKGFKGVEVPITFVEREKGASKMSGGIVTEALKRVLKFRLNRSHYS